MPNNTHTVERLLNEVQTITQSYDRVAEATGENFNIFSVLQMESDEVATHSRFLAELLHPKGTHGQGVKFLSLFIKAFAQDAKMDAENCEVAVEHFVGRVNGETGGQIDILIKDEVKENVIMIENKIYAGEQDKQLLRYHNAYPNGKLLFLTLFGEESKEANNKKVPYQPVSYETDIIHWLEDCKKEAINIPVLRESLTQYINLLKKLTNQNLNKQMSQDIAELVLREKTNFEAFKKLNQTASEIRKSILKGKVFPLLYELDNEDKDGDLFLDEKGLLEGNQPYAGFGFNSPKMEELNVKLKFEFQGKLKGLIFGFIYFNQSVKNNFDYTKLQAEFKRAFNLTSYRETEGWPCFQHFKGYENWEDFNTLEKIYFENFSEELKHKINTMKEIVQNIANYQQKKQ